MPPIVLRWGTSKNGNGYTTNKKDAKFKQLDLLIPIKQKY